MIIIEDISFHWIPWIRGKIQIGKTQMWQNNSSSRVFFADIFNPYQINSLDFNVQENLVIFTKYKNSLLWYKFVHHNNNKQYVRQQNFTLKQVLHFSASFWSGEIEIKIHRPSFHFMTIFVIAGDG